MKRKHKTNTTKNYPNKVNKILTDKDTNIAINVVFGNSGKNVQFAKKLKDENWPLKKHRLIHKHEEQNESDKEAESTKYRIIANSVTSSIPISKGKNVRFAEKIDNENCMPRDRSKGKVHKEKKRFDEDKQFIANEIVKELNENNLEDAKLLWEFFFNTPDKTEKLLSYIKYKPIEYALEHALFSIIEYFILNNTHHGKIILLSYDNYKIINKVIDLALSAISSELYNSEGTQNIFKLLVTVGPCFIAEKIEAIIKEKKDDKGTERLKQDFQIVCNDPEIKKQVMIDDENIVVLAPFFRADYCDDDSEDEESSNEPNEGSSWPPRYRPQNEVKDEDSEIESGDDSLEDGNREEQNTFSDSLSDEETSDRTESTSDIFLGQNLYVEEIHCLGEVEI